MPALRDLDRDLLEAAVAANMISAADRERVVAAAEAAKTEGKPAWAGQLLVRERLISCDELLSLQDRVAARMYECPHCQHRHTRAELEPEGGKKKAVPCRKCGRRLDPAKGPAAGPRGGLTRLEVLAAGDPLELTIPLPAASGSELDPSQVSRVQEVSTLDLDRYDVKDELGRGAYGVVFRAHHKDLQRDVALKVLRTSEALPRVTLERFIQEGRAISRLKHPHVIKVFDIGQHRDLYVMAMELVEGVPLKRWVKRFPEGKVPWREALTLFLKVLAGLAAAHEAGIVHRDLKPTNLLIDDQGDPKLIDFGLAKDLKSDQALTVAHAIVGTPAYLSPEQIEGRSSEVDPRSDVFALGAILFELLAGRRPWSARTKTEVYAQILREEPPRLEELVPELPPGLAAHVHRALHKQPRGRFAHAGEMRAALASVLAEAPASGPPDASGAAEPARRPPGSATGKRKRTGPVRTARPAATARPSDRGSTAGLPLVPLLAGGGVLLLLGALFLFGRGGSSAQAAMEQTASAPPVDAAAAPRAPEQAPARRPAPPRETTLASDPDPAPAPKPEPDPASQPDPDPAPEPDPAPAPDPAPEPEPAPAPDPDPAPDSDPAPEPSPEPSPAPAPQPDAPAPPPLDRGENDAREHPDLADRKPEEWLKRAFLINQLAEDPQPRPYTVHGLRLALSDPYERNPAFALRGLLRCPDPLLRAAGSQGLFEALLDLLEAKEAYLARKSRLLLRRLADGKDRPDAAAWRAWWEESGRELFQRAALEPAGPAGGADQAAGAMVTRVRNSAKLVSQVRRRGLEIAFLLDVTQSMKKALDTTKQQVAEIMAVLDLLLGQGKARMGFVTYGDSVVATVKLTDDLPRLVASVEQLEIFNDPNDLTVREAIEVALAHALSPQNTLGWRTRGGKAHRVLLLLADAPPLNLGECQKLARQAKEAGFVLHTLVSQPPANYAAKHPPWEELAELARLGGGQTSRLDDPEQLMTQLLVLSFGPDQEQDLRLFIRAYREVTRDNE